MTTSRCVSISRLQVWFLSATESRQRSTRCNTERCLVRILPYRNSTAYGGYRIGFNYVLPHALVFELSNLLCVRYRVSYRPWKTWSTLASLHNWKMSDYFLMYLLRRRWRCRAVVSRQSTLHWRVMTSSNSWRFLLDITWSHWNDGYILGRSTRMLALLRRYGRSFHSDRLQHNQILTDCSEPNISLDRIASMRISQLAICNLTNLNKDKPK